MDRARYERYLAALKGDPTRKDTIGGIEGLFAPLGSSTADPISRADAESAAAGIEHAIALADAAKLKKTKAFDGYRVAVRDAIDLKRQRGHGPFDAGDLAPLASLVPALDKLDNREANQLKTDLDRPARLVRDGGRFHDRGGPELALIPVRAEVGDRLEYPFAMGVTDVTRGAYERFAKAKNLKLVITAGIGSDHTDLQAAIERGITVAEVTYCNSISVAASSVRPARISRRFARWVAA